MEQWQNITVSPFNLSNRIYFKNSLILSYDITYPQFKSERYSKSQQKINLYYKQRSLANIKYVKNNMYKSAVEDYWNSLKNGYPIHEYQFVSKYEVTYNVNCIVSLYTDQYEYTGGAHGITARLAETWNFSNGKMITLGELFPNNPMYKAMIKKEIVRQIEEQIAKEGDYYFDDYESLVEQTFNEKQFYIKNGELIIYFQQYDIAPYSSGHPEFAISLRGFEIPKCM